MSRSSLLSRRRLRVAAAGLASAGIVLAGSTFLLPTTASAHVSIRADTTEAGGWAKLTVRVPTESDTASTTALTVAMPKETPFAFVSVKPRPGWAVQVTKEKLASPLTVGEYTLDEIVSSITWTASAPEAGIAPGQFDEFDISAGPLPEKAGDVVLPATQTYSDGSVVAWDQPTVDGAAEPEHPAPAFTVTEAGVEAGPDLAAVTDDVAPAAAATADEGDGLAIGLGIAALVLGAAGLGLGGAAFLRTRRA